MSTARSMGRFPVAGRRPPRLGWAAVAILAAGLSGCGSVADTVADLNPLRERETPLPGERQAFFPQSDPTMPSNGARAASVGAAQANPDWTQPGGNARNDPGHVAFDGGASRVWRANLGGTSGRATTLGRGSVRIAARPVIADGRVYVYTPDGRVVALSLSNGARVWQTSLQPEKERDPAAGGGVAVDGGRVFAATGYGEIAALEAGSGKVLWRTQLPAPARSAPTAAAGKVFLVTQTNEVVAIDQSDGSQTFSYAGIPETAGMLTTASPAVAGDKVVFPYSSGEVMAFDIASGEPTWAEFATRTIRTLAIAGIADVAGSPVVDGSTVFATGVSGRTIAVGLSTGQRIWESDIGSASTPVLSGNALFLVDLDNRLVALDRADGTVMWATALPKDEKRKDSSWSGPVLAGGSLLAISNDGRLVAADPTNGQIRSDQRVAQAGLIPPIVAAGKMVVVTGADEVSAFQ